MRGWHYESQRHALAARGIRTVHIRKIIEPADLTDVQLVRHLKAKYPNEERNALYSRYVQSRGLKPNIDAKEFYEIYDMVTPELQVKESDVEFNPTHRNKNSGLLTMVWKDDRGIYMFVDEYGSIGSTPPQFFDMQFEELQ